MKTCLVLIDIQNGFLSSDTDFIPEKIKKLIEEKRGLFTHIVATQFKNVKDSPYINLMGWHGLMDSDSQKVNDYVRSVSEKVFEKNIYSCFTDEFCKYISDKKIEKIFFAGIDTDCCVLKSASDCFEKGIPFEVLLNYCASNGGIKSHDAAITVLSRMVSIKNLNSAL